jgi:hypothetical protein
MIHCRPEEDKKINQTVTIPRQQLACLKKLIEIVK